VFWDHIREKNKKQPEYGHFAVCFCHSTRQSMLPGGSIWSLCLSTQQSMLFAVCRAVRAHGKHAVNSGSPLSHFILPCVKSSSRQSVCRVPEKRHTANMALPAAVCHVLFAVCSTRQKVCRVPFRLCRVPKAHGKAKESGSELIIN